MRLQIFVIAVLLGVATATTRYDGYKVFQLTPTASQLELLAKFEDALGYDIWSRNRVPGAPLDIMVSPSEIPVFYKFLEVYRIKNSVIIEDVQIVFDEEKASQDSTPKVAGKITFDRYYTHTEINAYVDEMAATYPTLASVEIIGSSFEGREMKVLKISSGGTNKPIVWIDAGIHAREWISPALSLFIINQLLEVPGNEDLYATRDWYILPVSNPDGYDWTHTNARLWRKTRSTVASTTCPGIDPNRNWDHHWNEVGASSNPCSETYAGPAAFSEIECGNMRNYINTYASRIGIYLTLHSFGNYFLYPWGWTSALPSDWQTLDNLARAANSAQVAAGGASYTIGTTMNVLYAAAGVSNDWAKGVAGIDLSYTIELPGGGPNGFDMPASQIQTTVTRFFPAIRVLGEAVV